MDSKTRRNKCLKMWSWLYANPGKTKFDYLNYLRNQNKLAEYSGCYACDEVDEIKSNTIIEIEAKYKKCYTYCPVTWIKDRSDNCRHDDSPYLHWEMLVDQGETYVLDIPAIKQAAKEVLELIQTTWIV